MYRYHIYVYTVVIKLLCAGEGPAPPSGPEVVAVAGSREPSPPFSEVGLSLQACGKMTDHHKELGPFLLL